MDRREALKKLAIGGATAVGASAVVSTPAFAFDQPSVIGNPFVAAGVTGFGQTLTVTVTPAAASCPASATGGLSTDGVRLQSIATPAGVAVNPPNTFAVSGPLVVTFTRGSIFGASSAELFYRVRYRCQYAASTSERCRAWTIRFDAQPFGFGIFVWSATPTSIVDSGDVCP